VGPLPLAKVVASHVFEDKIMETFKGHKFWVGAFVGAAFVYWVLPRILGMKAGS
jgi:hypothetical protein